MHAAPQWNFTTSARIIALGLAIMLVLAAFAEGIVRARLINWSDPAQTFSQITASINVFKAGIMAFTCIIVLDIFVAGALLHIFYRVHTPYAILSATLRILYVFIKGFSIVGLILAAEVYSKEPDPAFTKQMANIAMDYLKLHHYGFAFGLIFFGLHLIFIARILNRIPDTPTLIYWMLLLGGMAYIANSVATVLIASEGVRFWIVGICVAPMTLSEVMFGIWLWWRRSRSFVAAYS